MLSLMGCQRSFCSSNRQSFGNVHMARQCISEQAEHSKGRLQVGASVLSGHTLQGQ